MVSNCNPRSRDLIGKKSSKAKKMSVLLGQRLQTSGQRWTAKSVSCPKIDKLDGQNQCRKMSHSFLGYVSVIVSVIVPVKCSLVK